MQTTHLIALAVDMPSMTVGELGKWLGFATENYGVVPLIGEQVEPLAAVYPAGAAVDFMTALAGEDFSLQPIVQRLVAAKKVQLWPVEENAVERYRSVNEPSDFKKGRF
jgi:molybdopterin-guanine dinucleotide biosynthesis protein A